MTARSHEQMRRVERGALIAAIVGALAAVVLGWLAPAPAIPAAWRVALFACLQPALGSLIFILIYRMTGGQWASGLAPFLLAGVRLLPWIWVLILPLLLLPPAARPHDMQPVPDAWRFDPAVAADNVNAPEALQHVFAQESSRHMGPALRDYLGRPLFVVRALLYGVAFFLLAAGARRSMHLESAAQMRWFGPVGLIGLVLMLHLLAVDWFVLLQPGWYSTGFPLVWTTAQAIAGLAAAVGAALWFGAEPGRTGGSGRPRGLDWGNLLLASVMSWTYVAFVQLLIIWSGNLPSEISWYDARSHGVWKWFVIGLATLEFGTPFLLLLSRAAKRSRAALAGIAGLLLLGQVAYTVWLIVPAFPDLAATGYALIAALWLAAGGLFLNRYLSAARAAAGVTAGVVA